MLTSAQLANKVLDVCLEAQHRILKDGDEQYAARRDSVIGPVEHQRFETESLEDNLQGLEEELLDTINWAAMTILKIRERRGV